MFIKAHCPVCDTYIYHNIKLHALEHLHFEGEREACRYTVESVEVTDTLTEKELVKDILQGLHGIIHDGIEIEVLAGILKEDYGITEICCMEIIEKIQLELNMYCPDMKKLYYVHQDGQIVYFD